MLDWLALFQSILIHFGILVFFICNIIHVLDFLVISI